MKNLITIAAGGLLSLAACASGPSLSDSWRDPAIQNFAPAKTLVVAMSAEESFRRVAEDELVRHFVPGSGVASYSVLEARDMSDTKKAAETARAKGFDSALVLRVLGVDELQQHVPSIYASGFVTFSGQNIGTAYFWPTHYDESYTYVEKTYRIETNLYSLADDKLVWSGVVQLRDPDSVKELAALNAAVVLPELRRLRLLR
jgi:hypothetical protein